MTLRNNGYNHHNILTEEKEIFLRFMKEKYPIHFNSNIFFRDLHYAIKGFFTLKERPIEYARAEQLTYNFIKQLEETGELVKVNSNAWRVNFNLDKPEAEEEIENEKSEEENKIVEGK